MADSGPSIGQDDPGFFEATVWSTVLKAKGEHGLREQQAALERLLSRYRQPILRQIQASVAGHWRTPEQVEDLTQEFIHQCLRLDFLKKVNADQGRFRTFIKVCIKNFLRDQHVRETAKKRGSGQAALSIDETDEEGRRLLEPAGATPSPDTLLDREWALNVLGRAMDELKRECSRAQREALFEALKGHLGRGAGGGPAKELGARLGMTEGAVNVAMNRMRRRLGELISDEVRQTVGTQGDWREELKYLVELLG